MPEPDRSLTIAHVDAEKGFSGGEEQVFLLMEGLRRRGHRNVLFCPPGSSCEEVARSRGLETRGVAMRGDFDLSSVLRLGRGFSEAGVDFVHLHTGRATWLGGIAAHLERVPAVTTRRMDREVKRNWRTRLIYGRFVRRAVAISPAVAECLAVGGVPRESVVTIPSAVDPGAVRTSKERASIRAGLDLGPDDFVLLTLASLVPRKGVDLLIDAVASAPSNGKRTMLLVAGQGPERPALERRAAERGVAERVRFLGHRGDKAELFEGCDVFVLASRREGLGVAALEAMAAGRAVIASRVGGLAEAVRDGTCGILVEPENVDALSAAIVRLRADPALRRRLGEAAPKRVAEGHLAEQMVAAYEDLYREVLGEWASG